MLVLVLGGGLRDDDRVGMTVPLNFSYLYKMVECSAPKVQDQKNGNNTRFVRAADEHRET